MAASGLVSVPVAWTERVLAKIGEAAPQPLATLFDCYVSAATVEEGAKLACLLFLTRGVLGPRTRYGAFLYALHAAMGFALVENVLAMLKFSDLSAFSARFILRAYMTVPMHLVAGGALGYLWARRRFDRGAIGLAGGLGIAIALHGTFNATLLAVEVLPKERHDLRIACAVLAMTIPLLGTVMLRLLAGHLRALDVADDVRVGGRQRAVAS
jgi:RsiW-degrading membrane proteinase PrsW (M82 family)